MNQSRWSTINRIFHAALEVAPDQRSLLVAAESDGDAELRAEVEALLRADADGGSYLSSPLIANESLDPPASPITAGELLCGRFRIVREIAAGGMGHVFEAFDAEVAVRVAVKVIRPEIAANPEAISRFRQEVRLARSITHPNICRTFDMERESRVVEGRMTELIFLTMEFLEGETLSSRIERCGPLPLAEALALARQTASALHAAHALGIVHRDMKPANIMLIGNEVSAAEGIRAVVTDFGLARLDPLRLADGISSFTNTGHPIGTLAYMAPEQLEGKAISPATDIYSFGLTLVEMITGKRAFQSGNLLSGIAQRLRGSLPVEQMLPPGTPAGWRRAITACLELNPEDRPRDTNDIIAIIDNSRGRRLPRIQFWRLAPRWMVNIAPLVVMALFAAAFRLYQSTAKSRVTSGTLVYLTQIKNETGKKAFDNVTELMRAGLSQSRQVNLLDQGRVGDMMQQMTRPPGATIDATTAREIAMRAGALRIIFATITGSRGNYSLNIDIQQPDNTPTRYRDQWTKRFAWRTSGSADDSSVIPDQLLTNVRSASDWIRHTAGESANDIARLDTPPEDVTTDNWQALSDYSNAEKKLTARQQPEAVTLLHDALDHDPKFAMAFALLGDILYTQGRSAEGNLAYRSALQLAVQDRLSLRERDRIKGLVAYDNHDYQTAMEAYREYTVYYPYDYIGWFRLARPLLLLGRTQESLDSLQSAHQADSTKSGAVVQLVRGYQLSHDRQSAHTWLETLHREYSANDYLFALGPDQFIEGDYPAAGQTLQTLAASPAPAYRDVGLILLAELNSERGDYQQSLATWTRALDKQQTNQTLYFQRAETYCKLHNNQACTDDLTKALNLQPDSEGILTASGILGRAIAAAPPAQAKSLSMYLASLQVKQPAEVFGLIADLSHLVLRGEILLAQGQPDAAVAEFRKAAALDAPINPKEYLARALAASAKLHHGQPQAEEHAREAAALYAVIAEHPDSIWWFAPAYPAGAYADSLESFLKLQAAHPGINSHQTAFATALFHLRPQSTSLPPHTPGIGSTN